MDFRPFKEGVNVAERLRMEREAQENVEILAYELTNKESGQVVELPYEQFLKEFKNYPTEEWEYDQIQSEPAVEKTKISDFEVSHVDGDEMTETLLSYSDYNFMIIAHKLYGSESYTTATVSDTSWVVDTIQVEGSNELSLVRRVDDIQKRQVQVPVYNWDAAHLQPWIDIVNPVLDKAQAAGQKVYAITAYADPGKLDNFREASKSTYPFHVADDILLKTIVRSNPGVVLMKNGAIIKKWHYKKLPSYEEIEQQYMQ